MTEDDVELIRRAAMLLCGFSFDDTARRLSELAERLSVR
jgi:hypothetical protein